MDEKSPSNPIVSLSPASSDCAQCEDMRVKDYEPNKRVF
jgi:hypothetical protein